MEMKQAEGPAGDLGPNATIDGTGAESQDILPVDYWSVNKRAPATTSDDLSESRWKQVSHLVQVWWSRIEDDELAEVDGKAERLAGLLQRRYGYTEYHAESQSIRWMRTHRDEPEVDLLA